MAVEIWAVRRSRKVAPSVKYSYAVQEEAVSADSPQVMRGRLKHIRQYRTAPETGSATIAISHTHLNSEGLSPISRWSAAMSENR